LVSIYAWVRIDADSSFYNAKQHILHQKNPILAAFAECPVARLFFRFTQMKGTLEKMAR
jgi:hypothetical protein